MIKFRLPSYGSLKTFGTSMLPLLHDTDVVYYSFVSFIKIRENDVLLVHKNNSYFTHRVIYKSPRYVITKGDNVFQSDGKIFPHQIIGRIYKIKRGDKTFAIDDLSREHNRLYSNQIKRVVSKLQEQHIEFVLLKGVPLFLYYSKKMPMRLYADCDLLVLKEHYEKTKKLLKQSGFASSPSTFLEKLMSPYYMEEDFFLRENNHIVQFDVHKRPFSFIRKIDIPSTLYPKKFMDEFTSELTLTRRWISFQDSRVPIPDKDYLLIFLAIHFFTHTLKMVHRLQMIKSVINKDKRTKDSWGRFLQLVAHYKVGYMVYPALYLTNCVYSKTVPREVLQSLQPELKLCGMKIYSFDPTLVFDDRMNMRRVLNKLLISYLYSPQAVYKRILSLFPILPLFIFYCFKLCLSLVKRISPKIFVIKTLVN